MTFILSTLLFVIASLLFFDFLILGYWGNDAAISLLGDALVLTCLGLFVREVEGGRFDLGVKTR